MGTPGCSLGVALALLNDLMYASLFSVLLLGQRSEFLRFQLPYFQRTARCFQLEAVNTNI